MSRFGSRCLNISTFLLNISTLINAHNFSSSLIDAQCRRFRLHIWRPDLFCLFCGFVYNMCMCFYSFLFVFVSVFLFSVLSFCYVFHSSVTYSCPPPLPSHHRHCLSSPLLHCFSSFFTFFFLLYLILCSSKQFHQAFFFFFIFFT